MQKLAAKDAKKRQKLEKLQRFSGSDDEEDSTLRELIHQCEALIREPVHKVIEMNIFQKVKIIDVKFELFDPS